MIRRGSPPSPRGGWKELLLSDDDLADFEPGGNEHPVPDSSPASRINCSWPKTVTASTEDYDLSLTFLEGSQACVL